MRFLATTLVRLADSLSTEELARSFLRDLGWSLASVPPQISALETAAGALSRLWHSVQHEPLTAATAGQVTDAVEHLWTAVAGLDGTVDPAGAVGFTADLARQILDYWLVDTLRDLGGVALPLLQLAGIVEIDFVPELLPRLRYIARRVRWDLLPALLTDPAAAFRARFGWGTPAFEAAHVLGHIADVLEALRATVSIKDPSDTELAGAGGTATDASAVDLELIAYEEAGAPVAAGVRFLPLVPASGLPGLALVPYVSGSLGDQFAIDARATVTIDASFDITGGVVLGWRPDTGLALTVDLGTGGTAAADAHAQLALAIADPAQARTTILDGLGFQLTATGVQGLAKLTLSPPILWIEAELVDGRLHWDSSQLPGVLGSLLGGHTIDLTANIALGWGSATGFYFRGGAGLSTSLPASARLGPITLRAIRVEVGESDGALALVVGVDGQLALGPVTASWQRLGAKLTVGRGTGPSPLHIGFDAAPPDSIGLAFSAGPFSGGGQISHASPTRYVGQLVLSASRLTLNALGVLEQFAGGGYSLAAIVSAQFNAIQLGLGFTLDGVGGLVAINRRVDTDALRAAVRGPGIGDIFFADDPIAQAGRLLGDLGRYFPGAEGRHVFGPAAKLGWGTPTLVEAELAILLEMPAPVRAVLLGSLRTALPSKEHAVIDLQIDVLGELDVAGKWVAIDASLRDSKVAGFPIVGDFALRASWGDQPSFIASVGGLHSQFRAPVGFPTLRRVRIPIGADDNPRLDVQGFLAVTSSTLQVGAQAELYAAVGPLNVLGSVAFEALIQRSPFAFAVDLSAGVALRRGTTVLAGVHFEGKLRGPRPWHVAGEACLSLWLFDLCVDFSATFGSLQPVELPARAIWPVLRPVLEDLRSWAGTLPAGASRVVTTAPPIDATAEGARETRLDPGAAVTVRQSVVPLNRRITRFAQGTPTDVTEVRVSKATIGGKSASFTPVTDWFPTGEFEVLTEAEKLSREGFERMDAGGELASAPVAGSEQIVPLEYETVIVAPEGVTKGPRYRPTLAAQLLAGQTGTREAPPRLIAPGGLPEETFVIASADTLEAVAHLVPPGPRWKAEQALAAYLAAHPGQADALVVVPSFEVAA